MFLVSVLAVSAMVADTETIIVTAERGQSRLQDEPTSISVIDGTANHLSLHIAETLNLAPGVMLQAGSGQEHLTSIRSPVLTGGAGAGSFLYLQDGVPLRSAGFANVNGLFDAQTPFTERFEIVRGPGEVTYGSNAVHGAVNIISPDPLAANHKSIRLSAGAFDRYGATYQVGRRKGKHGFFVGLHGYIDDGYRDESGVDQFKRQLFHGWEGDNLTIRTRTSFHHLEQETAGFVRGENAFEDDALRRSNPNPEAFRNVDHAQISSEFAWQGENWSSTVTPYGLWTDMSFRMHFLPSQALEENEQSAFGVLSTFNRKLGDDTSLLFGLDAEWADGSLNEFQELPDVFSYTQGLHYDYDVTSESIAPFVRVRHAVSEKFTIQAGARLNYTRYDYENKTDADIIGRFQRVADREDEFTVVTGKLAALYQVTDKVSLFASIARGARPPQTTDLYRLQINQNVENVDPETLDMLEIGTRFDHGRLSGEVVAFAGKKEHFLFRDADGFTVDDGETTHAGIEYSLNWQITEKLRAFANGTIADHEYDFDRVVARASEVIVSGNEVDTAPTTIGASGLQWTPTSKASVELVHTYVGAYYTDAANMNEYEGHDIFALNGRYVFNKLLAIDVALKNLTDERYATRADFAFGSERYFPGEERHLQVNLEFTW